MGNRQSIPPISATSVVKPADGVYKIEKPECKKYSKVRALVIGIGYDRTPYKLAGTRNDANAFSVYLSNRYQSNLFMIKLDDLASPNSELYPTKENVSKAFGLLCSSIEPDTLLIVYFSGHGGQVRDLDGDESDGKDETLCLLNKQGQIEDLVDDDIVRNYSKILSSDLVVILDCCHCGSSLDLKYTLSGNVFIPNHRYNQSNNPIYYIGGTIDSLCSYERNGRGYLTQVLINILTKHKNLPIQTLNILIKAELARLISPSKQSVTIASGINISVQQQFPI